MASCSPAKKRRRTRTPVGVGEPNPSGMCKCGCGETTTRAEYLYRDGVRYHNAHRDYAHGHHARGRRYTRAKIGPESPHWKGGRAHSHGYVSVWVHPDDPLRVMARSGSRLHVLEHRLVMARYLGRPLASHEQVHHINGVRDDNRLENLQLRIGSHGSGQPHVCLDCGSSRIAPVAIEESPCP